MSRVLLLLMAFFVSLSVTTATVAHATEPVTCIDSTTAQSMGHSSSDSDQVPADSEKGYPHHHGGCHAHQLADRVIEPQMAVVPHIQTALPVAFMQIVPASPVDPALRPPIA